jgi:hypothetical protein
LGTDPRVKASGQDIHELVVLVRRNRLCERLVDRWLVE